MSFSMKIKLNENKNLLSDSHGLFRHVKHKRMYKCGLLHVCVLTHKICDSLAKYIRFINPISGKWTWYIFIVDPLDLIHAICLTALRVGSFIEKSVSNQQQNQIKNITYLWPSLASNSGCNKRLHLNMHSIKHLQIQITDNFYSSPLIWVAEWFGDDILRTWHIPWPGDFREVCFI